MTMLKDPNRKPFDEALFEKLYQTFKAIGLGIDIPQMQALRDKAAELSVLLSKEATVKAIDFLSEVRVILLEKISELESKMSDIERKVDNMQNRRDNLEGDGK